MVYRPNAYQTIYKLDTNRKQMTDNKSKDDIADTVGRNSIKIIDEFTKAQPQFTQSVSNLQLDYIAAAKNTIQNIVSAQKILAGNVFVPLITPPYSDEVV